jgi:hypothetical protein
VTFLQKTAHQIGASTGVVPRRRRVASQNDLPCVILQKDAQNWTLSAEFLQYRLGQTHRAANGRSRGSRATTFHCHFLRPRALTRQCLAARRTAFAEVARRDALTQTNTFM